MSAPLRIYLSGGAANSDPDLSIGGVKSSVETTYQTTQYQTSTPVNWPSIDYCFGLEVGVFDNTALPHYQIQITGNVIELLYDDGPSSAVIIGEVDTGGVNGQYTITSTGGPNPGIAGVVVTFDNTATDDWWRFYVSEPTTNMFSDATKSQSQLGKTDYRWIYYENTSASTISISLYLPVFDGPESYEIGLHTSGKNTSAATLANEITAPSDATLSYPLQSSPLAVSLDAGDYIGVAVKRIIPTGTLATKTSVLNILANIV